jgi:hypothetical protein
VGYRVVMVADPDGNSLMFNYSEWLLSEAQKNAPRAAGANSFWMSAGKTRTTGTVYGCFCVESVLVRSSPLITSASLP